MLAAGVVYSVNARLCGGGFGRTACRAAYAIHQAGLLRRAFASSNAQTAIPAGLIHHWGLAGRALKYVEAKDRSGQLARLANSAFDTWTSGRLPDAAILHGWNGACLRTLARARQRGMLTVVERASSHPAAQYRLLAEEHMLWGAPEPSGRSNVARLNQEIEAADFVTVPSAFVRGTMLAAGVPERKIIELPFGVDAVRYSPGGPPAGGPFRVVFAGQVSIRKGVPYLLEAWKQLKWTDAELWIAGAAAPGIQPLLGRWSGLPGVQFLGHCRDVAFLLPQAHVFVFPTIEEGSALVTYEALACGLPIVTTPNAGSIARHGQDGFIVPIREVDALCEAMQRLRGDPALRLEMSGAARERAEQFPWERYQAGLIAAYRRIADG